MEAVIAQTSGGQAVEVWCVDLRTIAAEIGKAGIVQEDEDHVGTSIRRSRRMGPPGPGFGDGPSDYSLKTSLIVCHVLSLLLSLASHCLRYPITHLSLLLTRDGKLSLRVKAFYSLNSRRWSRISGDRL